MLVSALFRVFFALHLHGAHDPIFVDDVRQCVAVRGADADGRSVRLGDPAWTIGAAWCRPATQICSFWVR